MLVIDGHNLIPKVPGLSLAALDDEEQLIALLEQYARVKQKQVEVFFDQAAPGRAGARQRGPRLRAHFVQAGKPADEAIRQYLAGLKRAARNARVVTADRKVQAEARALGAQVISPEAFVRELLGVIEQAREAPAAGKPAANKPAANKPAVGGPDLSQAELEDFYRLFGVDPRKAEQPIEPPADRPAKPAHRPARPRRRHGFPKG